MLQNPHGCSHRLLKKQKSIGSFASDRPERIEVPSSVAGRAARVAYTASELLADEIPVGIWRTVSLVHDPQIHPKMADEEAVSAAEASSQRSDLAEFRKEGN